MSRATLRLAVVSDIHGNLPALEAVVADFTRRGVDAVVNLGDSLSGPLLPRETAQYLMAQDWTHLAGNHERYVLRDGPRGPSDEYARAQLGERELAWLATLRPCLPYAEGDVLLCHGTPARDSEYFLETLEPAGLRLASAREVERRLGATTARLVLCGHTHLPRALRTASGTLIVNPGSVGLPGYLDDHPFPHAVQTGSPDARYAIVERIPHDWTAALIAVPYDPAPMAALAAARQRPEWQRALRTGYVT
jgi:predicted phosphodiesterase